MTTCAVESCDREAVTRGWCQAHYRRWKTHGSVDAERPLQRYAHEGCSVDGCEGEHHAHGLCSVHSHLLERHGDPLVVIGRGKGRHPAKRDPADRFWEKVDKSGDCWLWTAGVVAAGYGWFWLDGRNVLAHRYAYELEVGPIPEGLHIDHLCRRTNCVRPSHLEPVTPAENARRENAAVTECKHGHEYTPENTYTDKRGHRSCKECRLDALDRHIAKRRDARGAT